MYTLNNIRSLKSIINFETIKNQIKYLSYIQGQHLEANVREYFYYIDHQGMLFLDDTRIKNFTSCLKDKKFLKFFFGNLKVNNTNRYEEFPYVSLCGKERNYVRCDDLPIVFTHIIETDLSTTQLGYNHAGNLLTTAFIPDKIIMIPETGRVYHPFSTKVGGIGLIASKLAIELSKFFKFENGEMNPPTHFIFKDTPYKLDNSWYCKINN